MLQRQSSLRAPRKGRWAEEDLGPSVVNSPGSRDRAGRREFFSFLEEQSVRHGPNHAGRGSNVSAKTSPVVESTRLCRLRLSISPSPW